MRQLYGYSLAIVVLAVSVAWGLDMYGRGTRSYSPAGGSRVVHVVAAPTDAYRIWKKAGMHGRTILYVGDRWAKFDPNRYNLSPSYRPYPLPVYNLPREREREFLDDGNFLFMAALTGIARRVDAVLSDDGFDEMRETAQNARNASIDTSEIFLTHNGYPRTFRTVSTVKIPAEPVLLYVGASWFIHGDPATLEQALLLRDVPSDLVVLCEEKENPAVTPEARRRFGLFSEAVLARWGRTR